MTKARRTVAAWLLGGTVLAPALAVLAAPAHADTRVELKQPVKGEVSSYAALLADIQARLQQWMPGIDIFSRKGLLSYGLVDLDGDGTDEVLVHAATSYWCGNMPTCRASVYTPRDGGWRYIGRVSVREGRYPVIAYAVVEDHFHKSWRTLNDGEFRYCWVADPEGSKVEVRGDQFKMPRAAGEPGYHWAVHMNEQCPDK